VSCHIRLNYSLSVEALKVKFSQALPLILLILISFSVFSKVILKSFKFSDFYFLTIKPVFTINKIKAINDFWVARFKFVLIILNVTVHYF
jgi:hypothetical protein